MTVTLEIVLSMGVFVILALGLTIPAYALKVPALAAGASGAWAILAFYAYQQGGGFDGDPIYAAVTWMGIGMIMVCAMEPMLFNGKKAVSEIEDEYEASSHKELKRQKQNRTRLSDLESLANGILPEDKEKQQLETTKANRSF